MNTSKTPKPNAASAAASVRRLLQSVRACKAIAELIPTDDHATMDEIEQKLADAEAAALRLLNGLVPEKDDDGVVDLDDF